MRKKTQVIFYYPQHFNRSAEGTNPFFDRLLEACDNNGISYRLYEEPDYGTDKLRNPKARKADVFLWVVRFVRKVVKLFSSKDFFHREKYVAHIVDFLTLRRFHSPVYVTISESMLYLFAYINDNGKVFDVQHGVQFREFRCFYDEASYFAGHYDKTNIHFFDYGSGYRDALIDGAEERIGARVHVIGYPVKIIEKPLVYCERGKTILIALQLTDDSPVDVLQLKKRQIAEFLSGLEGIGCGVLLRHHPRYNNCISLDDILERFSFVNICNERLEDVAPRVLLHATVNSTTAFDIAPYGVPSFFFGVSENLSFYKDYHYPLYEDMNIREVINRLSDPDQWNKDIRTLLSWYNKFYEPFNEEKFISLLTN